MSQYLAYLFWSKGIVCGRKGDRPENWGQKQGTYVTNFYLCDDFDSFTFKCWGMGIGMRLKSITWGSEWGKSQRKSDFESTCFLLIFFHIFESFEIDFGKDWIYSLNWSCFNWYLFILAGITSFGTTSDGHTNCPSWDKLCTLVQWYSGNKKTTRVSNWWWVLSTSFLRH